MQFIFFQCFLSVYTQYLWPISPISPMQCFYGPLTLVGSVWLVGLRLPLLLRLWPLQSYCHHHRNGPTPVLPPKKNKSICQIHRKICKRLRLIAYY